MIITLPDQLPQLSKLKGLFEIKIFKRTRSGQQNKALHLFYSQLAESLTDLGYEFNYVGITGEIIAIPYSKDIIKEFVWRPIQKTMFNIESTTKINTVQINQILDVLAVHYSEVGIPINFPCEYDYYLKQLELKEKYNLN